MALCVIRHLRIQRAGHNGISHLKNSDLHLLLCQILRHLQTNEACTDDNGLLHLFTLHILSDPDGIVRLSHREDTLLVRSLHRRQHCARTGGNDQFIVGVGLLFSGSPLSRNHGLLLTVDTDDLTICEHTRSGQCRIFFRCVDDQLLSALDQPAHIVGKAAAGIRNVGILRQNSNLRAAVTSLQFRCSLGTCRNTAYHDYSHRDSSLEIDICFPQKPCRPPNLSPSLKGDD